MTCKICIISCIRTRFEHVIVVKQKFEYFQKNHNLNQSLQRDVLKRFQNKFFSNNVKSFELKEHLPKERSFWKIFKRPLTQKYVDICAFWWSNITSIWGTSATLKKIIQFYTLDLPSASFCRIYQPNKQLIIWFKKCYTRIIFNSKLRECQWDV